MGDRSRNPDEHQTTTTTLPPPTDSLTMTLRVGQKPDDVQVNDVEMKDPSSNTGVGQPGNPVDHKNQNPSASNADAAQASQGGSSSRRAVDQVIERNENSEGQQELGRFKLPKSIADTLIKEGGVAQKISNNKSKGKDQSIGCFEVYDG